MTDQKPGCGVVILMLAGIVIGFALIGYLLGV